MLFMTRSEARRPYRWVRKSSRGEIRVANGHYVYVQYAKVLKNLAK